MSDTTSSGSLLGKRKKKKDPNPNPLFSKWLAEWRDEAKEKGWKSEHIYSRALRSLHKFPLPLATGKECKILQNFGDKICKMLDDRLLKHSEEQENQFRSGKANVNSVSTASTSSVPHGPVTVHEISDSSDDEISSRGTGGGVPNTSASSLALGNLHRPSTSNSLIQQTAQREALINDNDNDDDEISVIGQTFPVAINDEDDSDHDDNPVMLPRLPELAVDRDRERREIVVERAARVVGAGNVTVRDREAHGLSDSEEEGNRAAAAPRRAGGPRRPRAPREYVPAYRSGPYAILLTLYRNAQMPDFRGFMTKAELCRAAQPLADKSFTVADPMNRYTAWSSVSILTRKGFLIKESNPAKYRLTETGHDLAHRLENVERNRAENGENRDSCDEQDAPCGDQPAFRGRGGVDNQAITRPGTDVPRSPKQNNRQRQEGQKTLSRMNTDNSALYLVEQSNAVKSDAINGEKEEERRQESSSNLIRDYRRRGDHDGNSEQQRETLDVDDAADICVVQDDDMSDDSDDLPDLGLPSLANRINSGPRIVQGSASSSATGTVVASSTAVTVHNGNSNVTKLRYWYVADNNKLVTRKDEACVSLNGEFGVGFLVKVCYQHLLQSGFPYKLDLSRPLGDDYVFAYLADDHCHEEAPSPISCQNEPTRAKEGAKNTSKSSKTVPKAPEQPRSAASISTNRRIHEISDSDSELETELPDIPATSSSSTGLLPATSASSHSEALHQAKKSWQVSETSETVTWGKATTASSSSLVLDQNLDSGLASRAACSSSSNSSLPKALPVSSVTNLASNVKPSSSLETVEDFVLYPGSFEVVLCVDNREFYGSNSSSKSLLPDLIKSGVNCDLRQLNVGDLLWVAREKVGVGATATMLDQAGPARRELVLNYVVERKRMDDLVSSMISGRLRDQKFRLKHSGVQEKIILIENYGSLKHFSISEERIKQAIANTEIIDGFIVKQTQDPKETAAYLTLMTRYLQSFYQDKTLQSCSQDRLKELGVRSCLRDREHLLMPFPHFNQASLKSKPLRVLELFAKQLIQLWGMSAEKAKAIVDKYPTPVSLFDAYATCSSEKDKESLLANLKYGKNLRNLGISVSRQVAQLYTTKKLT